MTRLERVLNKLQMRHDGLVLALRHQAETGDYARALETRARADEVLTTMEDVRRLRVEEAAETTTQRHTTVLGRLQDAGETR